MTEPRDHWKEAEEWLEAAEEATVGSDGVRAAAYAAIAQTHAYIAAHTVADVVFGPTL